MSPEEYYIRMDFFYFYLQAINALAEVSIAGMIAMHNAKLIFTTYALAH